MDSPVLTQDDFVDGNASGVLEKNNLHIFDKENTVFLKSEKLKFSLSAVKWVGVLLLITSGVVPGYILMGSEPCSHRSSKHQEHTDCQLVKQFSLQENVYVSVCNVTNNFVIDIRKFVRNNATVNGVRLTKVQWTNLQQTIHGINDVLYVRR